MRSLGKSAPSSADTHAHAHTRTHIHYMNIHTHTYIHMHYTHTHIPYQDSADKARVRDERKTPLARGGDVDQQLLSVKRVNSQIRFVAYIRRLDSYRVAKTHRMPCLGRTAARRTAPKLPRAIRVGPNEGGGGSGSLSVYPGVYQP